MGCIAVVDDDSILVEGIARLIRAMGHQAFSFTSAAALLSSDVARFDCVVSDVLMPDMGGLALLAALQSKRPSIPVILISGFIEEGMRESAKQAGAICVLAKPFDDAELERHILTALRVDVS